MPSGRGYPGSALFVVLVAGVLIGAKGKGGVVCCPQDSEKGLVKGPKFFPFMAIYLENFLPSNSLSLEKGCFMDDLDKIDFKILSVLADNGRITVTDLAKEVGLSKTPCQLRMRKLEENGYILGYSAVLDPERLGERHIAFVQVSLSDTRSDALHAFNEAVRHIREVEQCHMIASNFDYLLKIRTRDMGNYRRVLGEKISALPHVSHTSTFVVMESVKERA